MLDPTMKALLHLTTPMLEADVALFFSFVGKFFREERGCANKPIVEPSASDFPNINLPMAQKIVADAVDTIFNDR